MSSFRSVALVATLVALGGCPESQTEDTSSPTPTPPPSEVDTDTIETGLPYLDVTTLNLTAQFGFDAATGTLVPVTIDGTAIAPAFEINLANDNWTGSFSATDDYCTIAYDLTGLTPTVNSAAEPWLEITVPAEAPTVSNCEIDPEVWGEDPAEAFRGASFGIQVGTLATDVREWLEPQLQPGQIDEFNGGVLLAPDILPEPDSFSYSTIYAADAALAVSLDANGQLQPLPEADLRPDAPTAWYTVSSASLWTLQ